jgi:hypothetical protein
MLNYNKMRSRAPKQPALYTFRVDGGVCYAADSEILENQCAPPTKNVFFDGKTLNSRPGLAKLFATSLGAGQVNGFWDYRKKDGSIITLVHWNTGLYTQSGANQPVQIYNALANAKSNAITNNGVFFLLDGTNFITYDGTTVQDIVLSSYIPVFLWNKKPDGTGGVTNQKLNNLTSTWYEQFTSQGSATDYIITGDTSITSIDEVKVNGVVKVSGVDYTPNVGALKITFIAGHVPADATGSLTNNVQIKVTRTGAKDPTKIKKCTVIEVYNDRIIVGGNPDDPYAIYWTGILTDTPDKMPFYYPDDKRKQFDIGAKVTGMKVHNSSLIIFKQYATYRLDPSSVTGFDWEYHIVDQTTGCDMPGTIQLVDNQVIFANSQKGVCILRSALITGERNIDAISQNINGSLINAGLLDEQNSDLLAASSVDTGQYYLICVKDKAWVWDYVQNPYGGNGNAQKLPWWPWTNINANCFLVRNRDIYFGDRTNGTIAKFTPGIYNDFGAAINKIVRTKRTDFNKPQKEKNILKGWLVQQSGYSATTKITYYSDSRISEDLTPLTVDIGFDYDDLDYDDLMYDGEVNNKTFPLRPSVTRTIEFQVELSNNSINENISMISLYFEPIFTREVR